MVHNYCSIASSDYIYKVLTLYSSVAKHDKEYRFFIICMNEGVSEVFSALKLGNVVLVRIKDIEVFCPDLVEARKTRNDKEYAWTVKPSAFLYIFNKYADIDHILWLDGDTMFLSDPSPIYTEWGKNSILLTLERYSGKYAFMADMYGVYNTGLLGFKRDESALECLKWLQGKLNEWCYDRMENGLWSDQIYMNDCPHRFKGVKVLMNPGINMTPFILWRLTGDEKKCVKIKNQGIYVRNTKLILFHYYGFKYNSSEDYELCSYKNWGFSEEVIRTIYMPYMDAYRASVQKLAELRNVSEQHDAVYNFCTLTTLEYLPKSLALLASIERHTQNFHLWICAMDTMTYEVLKKMQLRNVTVLALSEIENESLRSVKGERKEYEYCWTLKAPLILHIFENFKDVEALLYVDSDVFMFSSPEGCFEALNKYPVFLTCHNFTQGFRYLNKAKGRINAGIVGFRRCNAALKCLKWWKRKCIEWCYDVISEGRFADQKYLEEFIKSPAVAYVAESVGMNAAIWNVRDSEVLVRNGNVYIDEALLVYYHFSSFLVLNSREFDLWKWDNLGISSLAKDLIYKPYAEAVAQAIQDIEPYIDDVTRVFSDVGENYKAFNHLSLECIK